MRVQDDRLEAAEQGWPMDFVDAGGLGQPSRATVGVQGPSVQMRMLRLAASAFNMFSTSRR